MSMHHQVVITGVVLDVVDVLWRQNRQDADRRGQKHDRELLAVRHRGDVDYIRAPFLEFRQFEEPVRIVS